ncbi:hypothetical protein COU59_00120 [Candidatus Pacearchaeota archaeon CG10_big_fil_rev_8_21_14_0_10_34_12]|nr:MAG: hypothetical protein COU59_00120 [Candidatus Pacearchaeota archaeon CG10_big_fil_rev_8_21_14_0_10_34_12]
MESAEKQEKEMEELQIIEQRLNNILMQKQSFQIELSETQSALKELAESEGDVFRVIGQLMVKSSREKMNEELSNKEKIIDMKINSLEKQESSFMEKLEFLRDKVLKTMKK